MQECWRWFGPDDPVTLAHARQAGATGIVTALHHMNKGMAWTADEVAKRRAEIEAAGLVWSVVESIAVPECIKTRDGDCEQQIENWIASMRAVAAAGVKVVCYNFMAITDWTRTDLMWPLPHGGFALRFDRVDFIAYDAFVLKRKNLEYGEAELAAAKARFEAMPEARMAQIERNLIDWVPARETAHDRQGFLSQLARYEGVGPEALSGALKQFLKAVVPVAEEMGVALAIHPDDPPFPLFGLPRVNSTAADARAILAMVPSPSNGITLCTGSYGASAVNELPAMAREFAPHIHFAHLRNTTREADGSFHEANHLDGDTDMIAVVKALLDEEVRRGASIPMRPDHGHSLLDDTAKQVNPGYSCIGRLKGLAELRGVMRTLEAMR